MTKFIIWLLLVMATALSYQSEQKALFGLLAFICGGFLVYDLNNWNNEGLKP